MACLDAFAATQKWAKGFSQKITQRSYVFFIFSRNQFHANDARGKKLQKLPLQFQKKTMLSGHVCDLQLPHLAA